VKCLARRAEVNQILWTIITKTVKVVIMEKDMVKVKVKVKDKVKVKVRVRVKVNDGK
jgi:hypothetical protein